MHFRYYQRLTWISAVLLLFFLLLFGSIAYVQVKVYCENEVTARQMGQVKSLKMEIDSWLEPSIYHVENLAKELEMFDGYEQNRIVPLLARAKKTMNAVQVYLGLEDGRMMYDTGKELSPDWYDPRIRPWYIEGLKSTTPLVSEPFIGFASNQQTMTIMMPIWHNEQKQGVVAASFYVNKIYQKIKPFSSEKTYAFIVNSEGKIIVHPDKSMMNITLQSHNSGMKNLFETMQQVKEGSYIYNVANEKVFITFSQLTNGWYSVVVADWDYLYTFLKALRELFFVIGFLMISLTVTILAQVYRHYKEH